MSKKLLSMIGGAMLLLATVAGAHHSAAQFNFRDKVILKGVVKKVRVENPHTQIILELNDAKGKRDVEFEGHSLNNFYRAGWRTDTIKVGEVLEITIAPMKDGSDGGYVTAFKTASGKEVGSSAPAESK